MKNIYTEGILHSHNLSNNVIWANMPYGLEHKLGFSSKGRFINALHNNSIDHHKAPGFTNPAPAKQKEAYEYISGFFSSFRKWAHEVLEVKLPRPCKVSVQHLPTASFAGCFRYSSDGAHEIILRRYLMNDLFYFSIVLAHEYVHYVHWVSNNSSFHEYRRKPLILSEGLAEHGSQHYIKSTGVIFPAHLEKSWNPHYETGRLIVKQVADNEGFGLDGVMRMSNSSKVAGAWKGMDRLFK